MAATKRPAGINFEKILQSVKGDIQEMLQEYQEGQLPITDDNKSLHQFCDRLEFILNFGLRERTVLGGRRDVWQYFCKCLAERRNILEGLKIVKANRELKTSVGRSRSFVRYCLVHQCLADVVQQCAESNNISSQFYVPEALMLDKALITSLLTSLYQLCDITFDLPPTGHDLDVSWPKFARMGSSIWKSPSRTVSMSSLSSFTSQTSLIYREQYSDCHVRVIDDLHSAAHANDIPRKQRSWKFSEAASYQSTPIHSSMAPVGEDETSHECPSSPSSPISPSHTAPDVSHKMNLEVSELQQRLSHLEDDNASLRASCVSLQLKLDQVQQDTSAPSLPVAPLEGDKTSLTEADAASGSSQSTSVCPKCEQLSKELGLSQSRTSELETLHGRLEDQVKALEKQIEDFEKKEIDYKCQISALQVQLSAPHEGDKTDAAEKDVCASEEVVESDECIKTVDAEVQKSSDCSKANIEPCEQQLKVLQEKYDALQEQWQIAEKEKMTMRTNIHKVSASWFERKTRQSESEGESPHNEDISLCLKKEKLLQALDMTSEYRFWIGKTKDMPKLLAEVSFLRGKLELDESMCTELRKRVREYENVIDDQEIIIHGLKDQLDTFFTDNQKMSKQLSALSKLFEDLELTERAKVNMATPPDNSTSSAGILPTGEDFKEMANSLSKTYIKLKELILEKKSLVTEIERLNVLNVELQRRVTMQENRLISVSDALHSTWMLVSDAKEQHEQLHNEESILRYELKEKREILHKLREELEHSREQWHKIRQMNSKSEEEWNSMREELDERRRVAEEADEGVEAESFEGATAILQTPQEDSSDFEPPVDLLLDMAIEYGVMEADDETSTSIVAAMEGQDMHSSRLRDLEDQCSYLYQKLMASTSRSLTLASRLTALHQHYGSSDDDDDDDDDEEDYDDEDEFEEDDYEPFMPYQTEVGSPEPESYDTAYVSEADTGSASGVPGTLSEEEASLRNPEGSSPEENAPLNQTDEQAAEVDDDLCRGLINFLPRKIEILRSENQKLEERCQLLQEEKLHTETQLTANLEAERMIRQRLEEKLEHLGKCVDELKLERNGQISELEDKLKQKIASLSSREKESETLQDDLNSLEEKFEDRGKLLQITNDRVNQLEKDLKKSETSAQESLAQLNLAKNQANEFRALHEQLDGEYKDLKEEILALQQQISDLRFQVSSQTMERDVARKADTEKSEALEVATTEVTELKRLLNELQEEANSKQEFLKNEKDQLSSQVEKLNVILSDRDNECSGLNKHLQEAEVALLAAKETLSTTQSNLWTKEESTNQLNEDNMHLREKIIQLLREKDALWQANVRLEGAAVTAGRPWMDNKSTQECLGCNVSFSLTRRRHHCRSCGRIFCTGCSDNWINTAASSRRVRVCDDCFSIHAELATIIASPAPQCTEISESVSGAEGGESAGTSSGKVKPLPIGSKSPDDDEFAVISDDEVQSSRLSSSPSSSSPVSNEVITETRATTDILTMNLLRESPPSNAEAWVGANTRVLVPIDLPAGVTLHWHFSSEPKSVSFAVLHQPPSTENCDRSESEISSQSSQQRVLIPTTRVASAEGATVKGRLQTKQPGVYTLVFDNSCSRFTAKKVTYSLRLEDQTILATSTSVTASSSQDQQSEANVPSP